MYFLSDNAAPVCPEIMAALDAANRDMSPPYGADPHTAGLKAQFSDLFEREVTVFPLATGTAANALAAATLSPPYGTIFVHEEAHMEADECGAPEFFSGGVKLSLVSGAHAKMDPQALKAAMGRYYRDIHMVTPQAISLTQATELGAVYAPDEIAALSELARGRGLKVHMDGARFANAVASLGCKPADISWRAGVDLLSFGATKNGAMAAEALIFFDSQLVRDFEWRRKRAGHLFSKMRYISAQLAAYLRDDLWLRNARHANAMAAKIADAAPERLTHPVEANEIFLKMTVAERKILREQGAGFYDWGGEGGGEVRLVTAWNTPEAEVDRFIAALGALRRQQG